MDEFFKKYNIKKESFFSVVLFVLYILVLRYWLVKYGWYSFSKNWLLIFIFTILISYFSAPFIKSNSSVKVEIDKFLKSYRQKLPVQVINYFYELILVFFFLFITLIMSTSRSITVKRNTETLSNANSAVTSSTNDSNTTSSKEEQAVTFVDGFSGKIWVGHMTRAKQDWTQDMHVTYTFNFNYQVNDIERKVTKVEVSSISAGANLPKGDLKVLPYAHINADERYLESDKFIDWNTTGYTYSSDYSKMTSLMGKTYTPTVCDRESFCHYLDEVGYEKGYMALRFKYVKVAQSSNLNIDADINSHLNAFKMSMNDLSGTFTWRVTVYLDDGSSYSHDYKATLDAPSLEWMTNSSMSQEF